MKRMYASLRRISGDDSRLLRTIHFLCAAMCACVACGSLWLANQTNEVSEAEMELPLSIEEAQRLVQNSSQWTNEWQQEKEREQSLQQAAVKAISWLPREFDWQHTMSELQRLAESAELQIVEIRPGEEYPGSRVAVRTATLQIEGSYASVCRFLDGLTKLEHPLWASELTIQSGAEDDPLAAVIHLRIPVAGKRTAGAFLIEKLDGLPVSLHQKPSAAKAGIGPKIEATQHG